MSSNSASTSAAEQLVPFTGYYALDEPSGAFLLIDTNLIYDNGVITHEASVTISSMDEHPWLYPSSVYDFDSCCTFDNGKLTVTYDGEQKAEVELQNNSSGSGSTLSGTINGTTVTGATPFSSIKLPVFAAAYYNQLEGTETFQLTLMIDADHSVWYWDWESSDEPVQIQVNEYYYNYAMFVITLILNGKNGKDGKDDTLTFEMGTKAGSGRVAGKSKGGLLVSVTSSNIYPPKT